MKNMFVASLCALALIACGGSDGKGQQSSSGATPAPASSPAASATVVTAPTVTPASTSRAVLSDDFGPTGAGWLPKESLPNQDINTRAYENGEYVMRRRAAPPGESTAQLLDGFFVDAAISVDARLAGDEPGRYISMKCRVGNNGVTYYRMNVDV